MGGWLPQSPWRIIDGSGQTLSVTTSSATFANPVGAIALGGETRAIAISLAPTATATGALVRIIKAGTAATAAKDLLVKTTDPPLILAVTPGDQVSCLGLAACTAYLTELTH